MPDDNVKNNPLGAATPPDPSVVTSNSGMGVVTNTSEPPVSSPPTEATSTVQTPPPTNNFPGVTTVENTVPPINSDNRSPDSSVSMPPAVSPPSPFPSSNQEIPVAPPTPPAVDADQTSSNKDASDVPPVVAVGGKGRSGGFGKKKIATILGLLLLVGGAATGVFLVQQNQDVRERAQVTNLAGLGESCGGIAGTLCDEGLVCTYENGTSRPSFPDELGSCRQSTTTKPVSGEPEIQCLTVRAYSVDEEAGIEVASSWTRLTQNDLAILEAGDVVYFTVTGKAPNITEFTRARFKVNSYNYVEVTATSNTKVRASSDPADEVEFFYRYVLPEDVDSFEVQASIYHEARGWIDDLNSPGSTN